MIPKLDNYKGIVGKEEIQRIRERAEPLKGKHVVHVNATSLGGGVAEILNNMVFLMNDVGMTAGWRVILGSHSFFKVTKGMHNALQGKKWAMSEERKDIYNEYCKRNSMINHFEDHDIVVIHDPQPLGMIKGYKKKAKWIWRCHIDISSPYREIFDFILPFVREYDGIVVSSKKFMINGIKQHQSIIPPSIDPLSQKNKALSARQASRILSRYGIDAGIPLVSQISRFDPWKDHLGVLRMFKMIREKQDCQLVLMGDMASDDPQGPQIYHQIRQKAEMVPNVKIITEKNDLLVNALQAMSSCVFQNSIKEGFALTVSEAMWKGTPVLGTDVGGISLQVKNNETGFIIRSEKDGAKKALDIIRNEKLRNKLGAAGKEHVKRNFLITTHLYNYLGLFQKMLSQKE